MIFLYVSHNSEHNLAIQATCAQHYIWVIISRPVTQLASSQGAHITMSSSFYIESLIQSTKPKTAIAETRHSFEPAVPCSCCWTPSQSETSGLCQLCIPPSSAVHPFLHVRGATIPDASSLYSKEFLKAEHAHLSSHYPSTEEDRLRLVSYGNYL